MLAPLNMILIVGVALYIVLCFWLQREGSLNLGNALKALMVIPASLVIVDHCIRLVGLCIGHCRALC